MYLDMIFIEWVECMKKHNELVKINFYHKTWKILFINIIKTTFFLNIPYLQKLLVIPVLHCDIIIV